MSVLKIKDQNGQWTDVLSIKGEKGDNGQDYVLTENDKQEIAQDVAELVDIPVDDVQINGTSVVSNGVANIPYGTNNVYGIVKGAESKGINIVNGILEIRQATSSHIKDGALGYCPIAPQHQHESAFYGLAKASGDTTQSQSSNAVGTYTNEAKASIQSMLGVPSEDDVITDVQVNGASVVSDGVANISIPEPDPKGMVVKTTLVSGNQYTIDSTYDIIKATLSAGINVIVMAQNIPQPYVGNIQMDGVWYLAFGVSTTYNNYATLMGFLIPETYQNIAVWVEQSVHIPILDDSDIDANMVWSSSKISNELSQKVGDVQINGTSVVTDGVANVPFANSQSAGVAKIKTGYGLNINSTGDAYIYESGTNEIKGGTIAYRPITPQHQHESTFYGLAKAAGADEKDSTLPVGQYTDSAQTAIKKMIGVNDEFELIRCITLEEDSQTVIIDTDESSSPFSLQGFMIAIVSIASEETTTEGYLKIALNSTAHNQNRIMDLWSGIRKKGSNYKNIIIIGNVMKGIGHNIMLTQMDGNGYIIDSTGVINKSLYTNTPYNAFSNQQVINSIFIGTDSASFKLGAGSIIALYGVRV